MSCFILITLLHLTNGISPTTNILGIWLNECSTIGVAIVVINHMGQVLFACQVLNLKVTYHLIMTQST